MREDKPILLTNLFRLIRLIAVDFPQEAGKCPYVIFRSITTGLPVGRQVDVILPSGNGGLALCCHKAAASASCQAHIETAFGSIAGRDMPEKRRSMEAELPCILIGYHVPNLTDQDSYVLEVISGLLSQGNS